MSGEHGQSPPGRTKSSPKQGPLKATIAISSATKEGSGLRHDNNTAVTPQSWRTRSADAALGRRNSGATSLMSKSNSCNNGNTVRRTASLDSIYLRGLFPLENVFWRKDRSTQTEVPPFHLDSFKTFSPSEIVEDKLGRLAVRGRRRSLSRELNTDGADDTANVSSQTTLPSYLRSITNTQPKSSRSSEEGLNQEVESYTTLGTNLNSECDRLREPTPEGRRAPVADLLLSSPSMNQEQRPLTNKSGDSHGSSPEQDSLPPGSSPRLKLSREPPDGCERVSMKPILKPVPLDPSSPQQRLLFQLKQSSHSAFECLQKDFRETMISEVKNEQRLGRERNIQLEGDAPKVPDQLYLE